MVTTQLLGRDYFVSGDQIDEFTLLEIIGGGGEGGIWSAWDNAQDRIVAIKFFQLDDSTRTEDRRREELLALANIQHTNICKVYKTGLGSGFLYYVMEYYPSGSLADLLRGKPLSPDVVLKISAQIVSALNYIHHRKVIHRDLKPTNILVNYRQQAFLTDFGIARTLSDSTMALHTGQGTPAYSSPEQHTKTYIDVRTDIYSFGVMLYEMCTGEPPWSGLSSLAIKQLESNVEIPNPSEMNPNLPEGMHQVLKSMTAFHPEQRPATILDAFELLLTVWNEQQLSDSFGGKAPDSLETILAEVSRAVVAEQETYEEAAAILNRKMALWREVSGQFRLGATLFIYLENFFRKPPYVTMLDQEQLCFMALFSIYHGRHISFWWNKVEDPSDRLAIAENIFANEVGVPVLNLLNLMLVTPGEFAGGGKVGEQLIDSIVGLLNDDHEPNLIRKAIILLDTLVDEGTDWRENGFSEDMDQKFAMMAVSDEIYALDMASLLGKVKSRRAVEDVIRTVMDDEFSTGIQALAVIRQTAGSWPKGVPLGVRVQTWIRLLVEQVITRQRQFVRMFLFTWMGVGLAFIFHVFVSTRLPTYLVASRILNSIGSGLLFAPIVAAGLTITKWLTRRLVVLSTAGRAITGVITGALLVNLGFVSFHYLFLSATPSGYLILLGSILLSFGFGLSEALSMSKVWRGVISSVFVLAGLALTNALAKVFVVSPMLYYESGEPLKTLFLMFGYSCILGFVAQIFQDTEQR
ncbi:MAG: protein kinase [Anaerolineales bacterium]|nr:protein kinase [Anaerolineales bacterium]